MAALAAGQTTPASPPAARAQTLRPNILIIVTDDQRADTLSVMPKMRKRFKDGGIRFSQAFATTPLCCPARASIFTGRYVHNHGVESNSDAVLLDHRSTFQRYLQEAGYQTAITGKLFNSWDLSEDPPYFDKWAIFKGGYYNWPFNVNGTQRTIPKYSTDYIAAKSLDFLRKFEDEDSRPWLLYVAPYAPHALFIAEQDYAEAPVSRWKGNPAVFEEDRTDKPPSVQIRNETFEDGRSDRRLQLRTLMSVDDLVGRIFRTMRGLDENRSTLAFYLSDNGYMWAEHGLYDKGVPYTQSIGIPMLMRWPGVLPRGVVDSRLVANIDIAPTVLQAAGIVRDPAYPMDGRSLLDPSSQRERILTEYMNSGNTMTPPTWASLRTDSVQYVEYFKDGKKIFREYYDLGNDPWQLVNLLGDDDSSNDPAAQTLRALSEQLALDRRCEWVTCP